VKALDHRIPPPIVAILLAAGMWMLAPLGPHLPLSLEWRENAGIAIALVGISVDFIGVVTFLRARTTINPLRPHKAATLVTVGIYRVTRNPMYVGLALLMLGWAAYLGSAWGFPGPVLFVLYMNRFQIKPEERVLRDNFGEDYEAYAARVRRWL
jgi:protein-S-isoprenylcysteine O-methyltransferase Ste14